MQRVGDDGRADRIVSVRLITHEVPMQLEFDDEEPKPFDGWDEYQDGLLRMQRSGIMNQFVVRDLVPYLIDPERMPLSGSDEKDTYQDFYLSAAFGWMYHREAVPACVQVFMHPRFGCRARVFHVVRGFLAISPSLLTEEVRKELYPERQWKQHIFTATMGQLKAMLDAHNAKEADTEGFSPLMIRNMLNCDMARVLQVSGIAHYDQGVHQLHNWLCVVDENYPGVYSDALIMKRTQVEGEDERAEITFDTEFHVVGAMHGFCGFTILAPMVTGMVKDKAGHLWQENGLACPIQAVRFMAKNPELPDEATEHSAAERAGVGAGDVSYYDKRVNKTLFFRGGSRPKDPVTIPYMLCHGSTYDRFSSSKSEDPDNPEHGYHLAAVYKVCEEFSQTPMWKHAPPQSLLAAKGFEAMLPMDMDHDFNYERLRGVVVMLNPTRTTMGNVYELVQTWQKREDGSILHQIPQANHRTRERNMTTLGATTMNPSDKSTYWPLITPDHFNGRVYRTGKYLYTVVGSRPTMTDAQSTELLRLPKDDPLRDLEMAYPDHEENGWLRCAVPKKLPAEYSMSFTNEGVQEIYFAQLDKYPKITRSRFRAKNRADLDAEAAKRAEDERVVKMAQVLQAESSKKEADEAAEAAALAAAEEVLRASEKAAAEAARLKQKADDKARRDRAKEKKDEESTQKVPLTAEEKEDLERRADEAAARDRDRIAQAAAEERERLRQARADAKKDRVSPAEAWKRNQEAKAAIARAQEEQATRAANLRRTDPNQERAARQGREQPVVDQVLAEQQALQGMYEPAPQREPEPRRGGKKGGKKGGRGH